MISKLKSSMVLLAISALICLNCKQSEEEKSLLLYCAAGVKPVVEKVAKQYYEEYGIRVDLQCGGSGTLLSNIRVAKQGDLYLAADKSYIDEAEAFGLLKETQNYVTKNPIIQGFSSSRILEVIIIRQKSRSYYICYFDVNKYNEYFLRI